MKINSLCEIQHIIQNGIRIGHSGAYGTVIWYQGKLFKFDNEIITFFIQDSFSNIDFFGLTSTVYYKEVARPSVALIDYYNKVRDNIKLTKLPEDILFYKDKPLAYILPYHEGYQEFSEINSKSDLEYLTNLLNRILESLHELEDNGIYQIDLNYGENILCKDNDVQIIDLDGEYLKIDNPSYRKMVYLEYLNVIKRMISFIKKDEFSIIDGIDETVDSYDESKRIIKCLKKMI